MPADHENSAVFASLESLIQDKYQAYRLDYATGKKTSKMHHGDMHSIFKGRGMEFDEVRQYQNGDDARLVDWRLTAKLGKVYTKVFTEERDRKIWFLMDMRSSMKFGTKQAFKSVIAAHVMAMIAWFFWEKASKIGGIVLTEKGMKEFKPSHLRSKVMRFFGSVSQNTKQENFFENMNQNTLAQACVKLRHICRNGNVIFIISDFFDVDDEAFKCIASLARTNEVVFINIYDVLEGRCPTPNVYLVSDGHNHVVLDTRQKDIHDMYIHHFFKRLLRVRDFTMSYNIRYIPVSSDMDYYAVVAKMMQRAKKRYNR